MCETSTRYFHARVGSMWILEKAQLDTLHLISVFASGVICKSHSVFWGIRGAKCRRTIFHARVGLLWIP
jgi:hypothetical protein